MIKYQELNTRKMGENINCMLKWKPYISQWISLLRTAENSSPTTPYILYSWMLKEYKVKKNKDEHRGEGDIKI